MEGSLLVAQNWLREWPVPFPTPMFTNRVAGGLLTAEALSDGSIDFQIVGDAGEKISVTSIPVSLKSKRLKFGIAWKFPDDLSVFANGIQIASLKPVSLPRSAELPTLAARQAVDFSSLNDEARRKRTREETSRTARPGYRLRTLDEEVNFLHSATLQLQELVEALEQGLDYHLFGTLAMIRSLISRGGRNFQPLVQRVAGRLDRPLLLYAPIYENDPITTADPAADYRFDVLPEPEVGDEARIDLDVWLGTAGITKNTGQVLMQNGVIRLFADAAGLPLRPRRSGRLRRNRSHDDL